MEAVTGLMVNGIPIGIQNATIGVLIAVTALIWTIAQHIQMRNHERFRTWSSSAIHYLLKRPTPNYEQKGGGKEQENPNKNLVENE